MVSTYHKGFGEQRPVYEGRKNLYSSRALPIGRSCKLTLLIYRSFYFFFHFFFYGVRSVLVKTVLADPLKESASSLLLGAR